MFKTIQQFFESQIQPAAEIPETRSEHSLELATAALLIELTRADFKVEEAESRAVEDAVRRVFDLSVEETEEIIRLAKEEASKSLSIYEFTHLIDRGFPIEKKIYIVELLWRVAFSDSELEEHEEYLIRKTAKLLHVRHEDFIDAKIRAREYMRQKTSGG
jgi:uncharacterized tellurite resistance protein B-like protein